MRPDRLDVSQRGRILRTKRTEIDVGRVRRSLRLPYSKPASHGSPVPRCPARKRRIDGLGDEDLELRSTVQRSVFLDRAARDAR